MDKTKESSEVIHLFKGYKVKDLFIHSYFLYDFHDKIIIKQRTNQERQAKSYFYGVPKPILPNVKIFEGNIF